MQEVRAEARASRRKRCAKRIMVRNGARAARSAKGWKGAERQSYQESFALLVSSLTCPCRRRHRAALLPRAPRRSPPRWPCTSFIGMLARQRLAEQHRRHVREHHAERRSGDHRSTRLGDSGRPARPSRSASCRPSRPGRSDQRGAEDAEAGRDSRARSSSLSGISVQAAIAMNDSAEDPAQHAGSHRAHWRSMRRARRPARGWPSSRRGCRR